MRQVLVDICNVVVNPVRLAQRLKETPRILAPITLLLAMWFFSTLLTFNVILERRLSTLQSKGVDLNIYAGHEKAVCTRIMAIPVIQSLKVIGAPFIYSWITVLIIPTGFSDIKFRTILSCFLFGGVISGAGFFLNSMIIAATQQVGSYLSLGGLLTMLINIKRTGLGHLIGALNIFDLLAFAFVSVCLGVIMNKRFINGVKLAAVALLIPRLVSYLLFSL